MSGKAQSGAMDELGVVAFNQKHLNILMAKTASSAGTLARSGLESTATKIQTDFAKRTVAEIAEHAKRVTLYDQGETDKAILQERAIVIDHGEQGYRKLAAEGAEADLTSEEQVGIEAIVIADGLRPSLRLDTGRLDTESSQGLWNDLIQRTSETIEDVGSSVGRIDLNGGHRGTGFVIAEGVIVTNRHVLQAIANFDGDSWLFKGRATINFGNPSPQNQNNSPTRFKFTDILFCGDIPPDPRVVDFEYTDMAILRCRVRGSDKFPRHLSLDANRSGIIDGRYIYSVGFPAIPGPGVETDETLRRLFNYKFGIKRFGPGQIDSNLGQIPGDIHEKVFSHDATTLGGSSGSPIIDFSIPDSRTVVGLHFSGSRRVANFAHSVATLKSNLASLGATFRE